MTALIHDASFWVAVSTVLCVGFIAFKAYKPILSALDERATGIHNRLLEAEALRVEAEQVLAEYKAKSENALNEASDILKNAQTRSEQLRVQMESDLNETIARQEKSAQNRIARMEEEAIEAIKHAIVTAAMSQVRENIQKQGADAANDLEKSLSAITKTLH